MNYTVEEKDENCLVHAGLERPVQHREISLAQSNTEAEQDTRPVVSDIRIGLAFKPWLSLYPVAPQLIFFGTAAHPATRESRHRTNGVPRCASSRAQMGLEMTCPTLAETTPMVDAISGCWDHMAETWNNIDGRCACVRHRGIPSRRRECDVVLETGVKASACLRNATRHTGAIQGTLRQLVVKWRSARRPRMSSAEKPSTVRVEPRVVKGFRESCSVAHPGDNVDVLAHDQRDQLLTTQPSLLARTVHATQLHLEATFAVRKVICYQQLTIAGWVSGTSADMDIMSKSDSILRQLVKTSAKLHT
ncbi:hypothetical protein HPB50_029338 [Hyalomma asiaticum]|nr:hypothetical protein HPB50_029338 [Hyalomma asiaticum]